MKNEGAFTTYIQLSELLPVSVDGSVVTPYSLPDNFNIDVSEVVKSNPQLSLLVEFISASATLVVDFDPKGLEFIGGTEYEFTETRQMNSISKPFAEILLPHNAGKIRDFTSDAERALNFIGYTATPSTVDAASTFIINVKLKIELPYSVA